MFLFIKPINVIYNKGVWTRVTKMGQWDGWLFEFVFCFFVD